MENVNYYLFLIAALMVFYYLIMLYIRHNYNRPKFSPLNLNLNQQEPTRVEKRVEKKEIHSGLDLGDTRLEYPLLPPVNPMARNSKVKNVIKSDPGLYSVQSHNILQGVDLEIPPATDTNELVYSGGSTQMIEIPLQYNDPYSEPLRTQNVLVTPFNKSKYEVM
jgi:hypothetical protein